MQNNNNYKEFEFNIYYYLIIKLIYLFDRIKLNISIIIVELSKYFADLKISYLKVIC